MAWAGAVISRKVFTDVVGLVRCKRYVLGRIDRGSLLVELGMTGCRGNLAVDLAYIDAEVVGVEDCDPLGVRELRAERD